MATLVLTTVGGAIGGPVGAAIGGVLGQAVDRNVLLAPRPRQGPRLSDLKVQTSSYGTVIPKVFGTMRIAGCVIWSTELIETRSTTRGGKGRPGTTGYSYAASFAVALSSRAIAGVGRIWAEGKLLRGAAGDWKLPTGFRLHPGSEEQSPDPLIAALEADAPAYRGLAYVVFENLPLGDFGNRIPSLSFEVIGDAAPPTVGAVAAALGEGAVVGAGPGAVLPGYAAGGGSVAGALETLATIAGAWWVPEDGALRMAETPRTVVTIDADAAVSERRQPIETVPRRVTLSCYDPARDYQIGVQQAARPGGGGGGWREAAHEMAVALEAPAARGLAQALLKQAERGRVTQRVTLDATAAAIAPGDAVRRVGEVEAWRVTRAEMTGRGMVLDLTPPVAATGAMPADAGQVLPTPDQPVAATLLVAAELPPLDDARAETLRIAVLASGDAPGWRGAALMTSQDGGATWEAAGATAAPAIVGRTAAPVAARPEGLVDRVSAIEVLLAHDDMVLTSIDDAALDRGGNLALLGAELIQFRDAVQVAPRRWRLSMVLRGRRGSVVGAHAAATAFALVDEACVATIVVPRASPGATIRLLASGVGDTEPVAATVAITGASVAPPAPVRVRGRRTPGGGATVDWLRRSRLGWRWVDGMDAALGEERELYSVVIGDGPAARVVSSAVPELTVPAAMLPAGDTVPVAVRQQGTLAPSGVSEGVIEGDGR